MGRVQKVQKFTPPYHTRTRIRIRARLLCMREMHILFPTYYTRACACVIGRGEFLYLLYPSCDEKK